LVSARKPPRAVDVDRVLDRFIGESRASLFEPWQAMLARSDDLQRDVGDTVALLQVFFSKWVVEVIIVLGQRGTLRFNELKASLPGISGRTLTQRLRDLEERGLVKRKLYDEMPVRVEYSLTKRGLDVAVLALPLVLYLMARRDAG
jgi:DNA-binding HxlR family transcriptional regulator